MTRLVASRRSDSTLVGTVDQVFYAPTFPKQADHETLSERITHVHLLSAPECDVSVIGDTLLVSSQLPLASPTKNRSFTLLHASAFLLL